LRPSADLRIKAFKNFFGLIHHKLYIIGGGILDSVGAIALKVLRLG
jgi:hypothetical protein